MSNQPKLYFIWSNEHRAWRSPDERGYTRELNDAGFYTHQRAIEICARATLGWLEGDPPPEIPVFAADALQALVLEPAQRTGLLSQLIAEIRTPRHESA